jgi:tRNA-specific 2-thiouridylase
VKKIRPEAEKPGEIVHIDGRVLGTHDGIIHFTIGQRKGLGIGGGHSDDNNPFYVLRIDPAKNQVVVGPKEALAKDVLYIKECNWLSADTDSLVSVKFRSSMKPVPATIIRKGAEAEIRLESPQYGISPGQACVFYDGSRVLGGGWISGTCKMAPERP